MRKRGLPENYKRGLAVEPPMQASLRYQSIGDEHFYDKARDRLLTTEELQKQLYEAFKR